MVTKDQLREIFREAGRRLTPQRSLVLQLLRESEDHLDADALYNQAKRCAPDISLATVYRTLALLKELGLVEEHRLGEGHSHYEAVQDEPHYHFICQRCGKVIEFDTPLVEEIERELCEKESVCVLNAHLHLIGYCARCRDETEGWKNCET
jgi:Fe2+ or Zn2+ uptake regulation protein